LLTCEHFTSQRSHINGFLTKGTWVYFKGDAVTCFVLFRHDLAQCWNWCTERCSCRCQWRQVFAASDSRRQVSLNRHSGTAYSPAVPIERVPTTKNLTYISLNTNTVV